MRLLLFIGLCALAWYGYKEYSAYSYESAFSNVKSPSGDVGELLKTEPHQKRLSQKKSINKNGFKLDLFAEFEVEALVLSTKSYALDTESALSPVDLALGWGPMANPSVIRQLSISQSRRFYRYRWANAPPIAPKQIAVNSANMHMIPANDEVEKVLKSARRGQHVRINGYLTNVYRNDGWKWISSTTRHDQNAGACEVVYVVSAKVF